MITVVIRSSYTVEPVYNCHPREWVKMAVIDRDGQIIQACDVTMRYEGHAERFQIPKRVFDLLTLNFTALQTIQT